MSIKTSR